MSALALGAAPCRPRPPPPLVLGQVVVDAPGGSGPGAAPADRDALRAAALARLTGEPLLSAPSAAAPATHVLHIVLAAALPGPGGPPSPSLEVRLQPLRGGAEYAAAARLEVGAALPVAGAAAFGRAWEEVAQLRRLDLAGPAALVEAIAHGPPQRRRFAVQRAGERRLRDAVGPLCALLGDGPEPAAALQAVGALVAIGDPRAVGPLIDLGQHQGPTLVIQLAFAIASLGGRQAEGYLVTLSGGHPDEAVRRAAQDALAEMQRRRPKRQAAD